MKLKKPVIYVIVVFLISVVTITLPQQITSKPTHVAAQEPSTDPVVYLPFITVPAPPANFMETFDGAPAHPTPWRSATWDITVHSRNVDTWYNLEAMDAQHGPNCESPATTHDVTAYEDTVYQCNNHIMTAINASGYGLIYLTPNQMVDFSEGEAVIRWDMSTERRSLRDWVDVWITPYDDNLQLALMNWLPDLNGEPHNAVHIDMGDFNGPTFGASVYRNFQEDSLESTWWVPYNDFLEPSPQRRDTFELRISRTHIKFGMPDYNFWWVDTDISPLNWTQGVIQFGHHSYNPWKDGNGGPQTWHWDNVFVEPAVPFTILKADRRYVNSSGSNRVNFSAPAPANSHLRFAGIGGNLQVSFDNGSTWQNAAYQKHRDYSFADESFKSYWMPIPQGTSSVLFRGQDWWGGGWHFRDISIWSPQTP